MTYQPPHPSTPTPTPELLSQRVKHKRTQSTTSKHTFTPIMCFFNNSVPYKVIYLLHFSGFLPQVLSFYPKVHKNLNEKRSRALQPLCNCSEREHVAEFPLKKRFRLKHEIRKKKHWKPFWDVLETGRSTNTSTVKHGGGGVVMWAWFPANCWNKRIISS